MSITAISFSSANKHKKGNTTIKSNDKNIKVSVPNNYEIVIKPEKQKLLMTPQCDSFDSSEKVKAEKTGKNKKEKLPTEQQKIKKNKNDNDQSTLEKVKKITRIVMTVIMSALSVLGIKEGKDILEYEPDVSSAVVDFDSKENSISDIAGAYNIDEDVIRYSNGIYSDNDLAEVDKLVIPMQYDYIDDEIDKKTQALFKAKPYSPEYYSIGRELDALAAKKEEQEQVADVFSDGKTVYISLKTEDESPELTKKFNGNLVSDDYIEKLFDIKEGELHKYNTFVSENNQQGVYLGTTIKVPLSSIRTDKINISGYMDNKNSSNKD